MNKKIQTYFKTRSFSRRRKKNLQAERFFHMQNLRDLAYAAAVPAFKLRLLAMNPLYHSFYIPKPGSRERRLIEAPAEPLMGILARINRFLQPAYYKVKTRAAFGYVLNHKKEKTPRNILSNAQAHLGARFMLNLDLLDFFHQITTHKVDIIFNSYPFSFNRDFSNILSRLTTFRGRLTMGSPTSPALSNFACIALDNELTKWADQRNITFTRFVDDLTFSSDREITEQHLEEIKNRLYGHRFLINERKTRFFGEDDTKIVTGLQVKDKKVEIPSSFINELDKDLERLKHFNEVLLISGDDMLNVETMQKFEQGVAGKINFIGFVYGYRDPFYLDYREQFDQAFKIDDKLLSRSWLDFPYAFTIH